MLLRARKRFLPWDLLTFGLTQSRQLPRLIPMFLPPTGSPWNLPVRAHPRPPLFTCKDLGEWKGYLTWLMQLEEKWTTSIPSGRMSVV